MQLDLHQKALQCVKNYKKAEKELLDILASIDTAKTYLAHGVSSLWRYCTECLGLSDSETGRFIDVMRRSKVVPELKTAIAEGKLTVSKASRITSVITPASSHEWIQKAATLKQRELEVEIAKVNPKAVKHERMKVVTPELVEIRLYVSQDVAKKFRRTQEVLRTSSLEATFEQLVDTVLKYKDPVEKAKRQASKSGFPSRGIEVAQEQKRPVPAPVKHQLVLRDISGCQYEGCGEKHFVEVHHIKPISLGGTHELENLITLCWAHHKMIHEFSHTHWKQDETPGLK